MNMQLSDYAFKKGNGRNAIAVDPSYIKKSGKCTPCVDPYWSGSAGAVKRGLEILGIGVIDVDLHECMMLKAVQTTLDGGKEDMSLYDWYAKVLEDNKQTLQRITSVLVADSAFSKKPFVDKMQRIVDTGCKFNKLQHGINFSNMVLIEKETANMDHKLSKAYAQTA